MTGLPGIPGTQGEGSRNAGARLALTGAGLSLMLAIIVPVALLSHPAQGVALPALTSTLAGDGSAQPQDEQGKFNVRSNVDPRARPLSRAEAVALVQRRYRARVVRTHVLQDAHGRPLYEFRLLSPAGKVWTVRIDAYSGAELP